LCGPVLRCLVTFHPRGSTNDGRESVEAGFSLVLFKPAKDAGGPQLAIIAEEKKGAGAEKCPAPPVPCAARGQLTIAAMEATLHRIFVVLGKRFPRSDDADELRGKFRAHDAFTVVVAKIVNSDAEV